MHSNEILNEVKNMSLSERLLLVEDIWDSIAHDNQELPLPEWQKSELTKRYAQFKEGKAALHNWQDVHKELREQSK